MEKREVGLEIDMEIAIVGFLIFFAYAAAAFFRRTRVPDVLLLVLVGTIVGPILNLVKPTDFGLVGTHMGTIALIVLLYHGGATLNIDSLSETWRTTISFTLLAYVTAAVIVTIGGLYLFNLPFHSAAIFGAICGGTSSAVVIPIVNGLGLNQRTSTILVLESALTDVVSIILVLALINTGRTDDSIVVGIVTTVTSTLVLSTIIGFSAALLWTAIALRNGSERLEPLAAMALAFVVYGLTKELGYSGELAALAFGFGTVNANLLRFGTVIRKLPKSDYEPLNRVEMFFFDEIIFVLKTFFFVYLGISMYLPREVEGFVLIIVLAIYISRIFVVRITRVSPAVLRDASIASVMAPKGLAAAVLATVPLTAGIEGGALIRDKTFLLVLVSIVVTAVSVPIIEKGWLNHIFRQLVGGKQID